MPLRTSLLTLREVYKYSEALDGQKPVKQVGLKSVKEVTEAAEQVPTGNMCQRAG